MESQNKNQVSQLDASVKAILEKINDGLAQRIDKEFVADLEAVTLRLKGKQDRGEKLDLIDFKDVLKIYRNILLPTAMKQEADKLNVVRDMIVAHGSMGKR